MINSSNHSNKQDNARRFKANKAQLYVCSERLFVILRNFVFRYPEECEEISIHLIEATSGSVADLVNLLEAFMVKIEPYSDELEDVETEIFLDEYVNFTACKIEVNILSERLFQKLDEFRADYNEEFIGVSEALIGKEKYCGSLRDLYSFLENFVDQTQAYSTEEHEIYQSLRNELIEA
jgi:hypothetical protein